MVLDPVLSIYSPKLQLTANGTDVLPPGYSKADVKAVLERCFIKRLDWSHPVVY
jgi:hypothetical protein